MAPESIAVASTSEKITYAELDSASTSLAHYLRTFDIGPDVPVGIYVDRSPAFIVAALAIWKAGGAYLPLDPSFPPERTRQLLIEAEAPVLVSHRWMAAGLPSGPWRVIDLDIEALQISSHAPDPIESQTSPENLAYLIFTSGSTGRPKGVEITHRSLANLVAWHCRTFEVTAADRGSALAGVAFDAFAWEIWPCLASGAGVYLADDISRKSPEALRDWLIEERITVAFAPTAVAEQFITMDWPATTALRILNTGADTLTRRPSRKLPFQLVNNYGPTECTVLVTSGTVECGDQPGRPTIGRPIDNVSILVLDSELQPVPQGTAGELCIGGTPLARGYRGQPELTREKFIEREGVRLYRTGDRGRVLENGEIEFMGRVDDQLKIRGYRIEPAEVTAALNRCEGVAASAVAALDNALVAYVVPASNSTLTASGLRDCMAEQVPAYMVPSAFVRLEALPLTSNGKCDRLSLPRPVEANMIRDDSPAPAVHGAVEGQIAAIVSALVGSVQVRPDDNFFLIGGHSMLAAQLLAKLRQTFGVRLSLRQVFEAPTVSGLAIEVERILAAAK